MSVIRLFPAISAAECVQLRYCGSNVRGAEIAAATAGRRRSRKHLNVVPFFKTIQIRRTKAALVQKTSGIMNLDRSSALAKRKLQADLLEKYCGSPTYSPAIPPKSTKKLIRRPRIERTMVGTFHPVRQRRDTIMPAEDPYLAGERHVHNRQLPMTRDEQISLKAEELFIMPNEFDEKTAPPYMKAPLMDRIVHVRVMAFFVCILVSVGWYCLILKSDQFDGSFGWLRQRYAQLLLRLFPVDFLADEFVEEFAEREHAAALIHYNRPEQVFKRMEELQEEAQDVYSDTNEYEQPPPFNPPLLSVPR